MNSITFPVWGSAGVVIATDPQAVETARHAVLEVIDEFDRACSRFRADSELALLNERLHLTKDANPLIDFLLRIPTAATLEEALSALPLPPVNGHPHGPK